MGAGRFGEDGGAAPGRARLDLLAGVQGSRLIVVLGGTDDPMTAAERFAGRFGPGPVVVGPPVRDLRSAALSARAAPAAPPPPERGDVVWRENQEKEARSTSRTATIARRWWYWARVFGGGLSGAIPGLWVVPCSFQEIPLRGGVLLQRGFLGLTN